MLKKIFFPFQKKQSQLKGYWLHRLLMIAFFILIVATGFFVWIQAIHWESEPQDICISGAQEAVLDNPNYDPTSGADFTAAFDKCLADYPITHQFNEDLLIGILAALILSYVLQLIYFKIVYYIVFGTNGATQERLNKKRLE